MVDPLALASALNCYESFGLNMAYYRVFSSRSHRVAPCRRVINRAQKCPLGTEVGWDAKDCPTCSQQSN